MDSATAASVMADARSVAPEDFLVAERHHPGRVGQTYRLARRRAKASRRARWRFSEGNADPRTTVK